MMYFAVTFAQWAKSVAVVVSGFLSGLSTDLQIDKIVSPYTMDCTPNALRLGPKGWQVWTAGRVSLRIHLSTGRCSHRVKCKLVDF